MVLFTIEIIGFLLLGAGFLALIIHYVFEGECLPKDVLLEQKLAKQSLLEMDLRWQKFPNKSPLIVSLTTIPSRINELEWTLKSILNQTRPPTKIILNIPEYSEREQKPYVIPKSLQNLASVEIVKCPDWGPATKVIPTLMSCAPDDRIVVVDDDRIYPPFFLARLEAAVLATPDVAVTMAGWVVPNDLTDRRTTLMSNLLMQNPTPLRAHRLRKPRQVDVVMGVFGYLVRPKFFDLAALTDFAGGPPELRFVDDVRTSALCKVAKYAIPAPSLSFIPKRKKALFQDSALGRINRGSGGDENRHNTIGIRYYRDKWRVGGEKQSKSR